jgi:hypothetical protein
MASCSGRYPWACVVERVGGHWGFSVTPGELMARLSGLRRAQIGGKRAPHKPLMLLWLFGQFAATRVSAGHVRRGREPGQPAD